MKKVLKILSLLLIVPVLGIGSLLSGCKKESATTDDILKEYNAMVNTYQTSELTSNNNTMFTYGEAKKLEDNTVDYIRRNQKDVAGVTFDVKLDEVLKREISTENLKKLYKDLEDLYGTLLNDSNRYFLRYQKEFFNSEVSIDGKELYNLLNKLKDLKKSLESFNVALNNLTSLAQFITPQTQVMASKLKTFNYVYVDLINANFNFNLAFCDIHNKHILKDELVTSDTAERLVMEASLKYSYGYFLDTIVPYKNNNMCDTSNTSASLSTNYKDLFTKIDLINNVTYKENNFNNLKQSVDRFDIFLKLYKENVSDFEIYTYNQLRVGNSENTLFNDLDSFKNSLNAEQSAKLTVIENFVNYDLPMLLNEINNILN